jgi:hypothetical protein
VKDRPVQKRPCGKKRNVCRKLQGRVAEWFKAAVLKTAKGASPSWVRIPPLPPRKVVFSGLFAAVGICPEVGTHRKAPGMFPKRSPLKLEMFGTKLAQFWGASQGYEDGGFLIVIPQLRVGGRHTSGLTPHHSLTQMWQKAPQPTPTLLSALRGAVVLARSSAVTGTRRLSL